jgi:hypothetical protein
MGEKLQKVLLELEAVIIQHEMMAPPGYMKPNYSKQSFRAILKLFMSALMDKMYDLQDQEGMSLADRSNMATKAGDSLRSLIKTYTNIDTHQLYD